MAQAFYTAEEVAERLRLHVKTVRQLVRDGRLRGTRAGKQYRIAQADLDAFVRGSGLAGRGAGPRQRHAEVASTVHIDAIDAALSGRITTTLMGALANDQPERAPVRLESIYDVERARLTLIITGDVASTATLLKLINVLLED